MFNKYFEIKSCYERENNETKKKEIVIICNEIKGRGLLSSFTRFFVLTPEQFQQKFGSEIKKDSRNYGLDRLPLEVGCDYTFEVHGINKNLPENLK